MSALGQDLQFAVEAIWKVLLWSVILGAGLPVVFAIGIRSLAWGTGGEAEVSHAGGHPAGKVVAGILFLLVLYCVAAAIVFIIAAGQGNSLSFAHVIPTIKEK